MQEPAELLHLPRAKPGLDCRRLLDVLELVVQRLLIFQSLSQCSPNGGEEKHKLRAMSSGGFQLRGTVSGHWVVYAAHESNKGFGALEGKSQDLGEDCDEGGIGIKFWNPQLLSSLACQLLLVGVFIQGNVLRTFQENQIVIC